MGAMLTRLESSTYSLGLRVELPRAHRRLITSAVAALALTFSACGDDLEAPAPGAGGSETDDDDEDKAASPSGRDAGSAGRDGGSTMRDGGSPTGRPLDGGRDGAANTDASSPEPDMSEGAPFAGAGTPWIKPAPRAKCAEGDQADGTIAGLNGDYRCNLTIAGQAEAPHFLSLAWLDDCAYVNGADGTTVLHVAADGTPTVTTKLTEIGMRSNWESMKASPESKLLAGYESNGTTLTVYDLSADCKAPVLQSNTILGGFLGSIGHAGSFSPDGTVYYASSMYTSTIYAVDMAMPTKPVVISNTFDKGAHDLFIGKNGTRGYFAAPNVSMLGTGSLAIMDLTQVQERKPEAKGTLIQELTWEDGNISQYPVAVQYRGRDYLIITDELGSGNCDDPKKPQWGYARIFDIHDEKNPTLVSLIKTEAQDPTNCKAAGEANGGTGGFGLGTHYCNVDRLDNPRVLACGNWDAGLRVYDIRNPWQPTEVAYFDTKAANMPGLARILPEKREIWVAMVPSTFYVLKIAPGSALDQIFAE